MEDENEWAWGKLAFAFAFPAGCFCRPGDVVDVLFSADRQKTVNPRGGDLEIVRAGHHQNLERSLVFQGMRVEF